LHGSTGSFEKFRVCFVDSVPNKLCVVSSRIISNHLDDFCNGCLLWPYVNLHEDYEVAIPWANDTSIFLVMLRSMPRYNASNRLTSIHWVYLYLNIEITVAKWYWISSCYYTPHANTAPSESPTICITFCNSRAFSVHIDMWHKWRILSSLIILIRIPYQDAWDTFLPATTPHIPIQHH